MGYVPVEIQCKYIELLSKSLLATIVQTGRFDLDCFHIFKSNTEFERLY